MDSDIRDTIARNRAVIDQADAWLRDFRAAEDSQVSREALMDLKKIAKAVVAICGVVVVAANGLADDGSLSLDEIVAIGTAVGVALGVYSVPNKKVV